MSSDEAPNSMAIAASAIMLPASGPRMCTPSTRSVLASARILTKPSVVEIDLGAAIGGERKFADIVGDAGGFQLFLGFADGGDFRIGIDHVRNHVVVHMAGLAGEDFGDRDAFLLRLVRQHRPGDDVADGIDAGDIGAEMRIDDDAAAIVLLHAGGFEAEAFGVGHAPDRDQHDIGFERLRCAAARGRLDLYLERLAGGIDRGDFRRQLERQPLLLQHAMELLGDFAVDARQDVIEEFDDRHFGAEPPPHRAELEPDDAGADDEQLLRHLGEIERAGRRHDALLVDVDAVAGAPRPSRWR